MIWRAGILFMLLGNGCSCEDSGSACDPVCESGFVCCGPKAMCQEDPFGPGCSDPAVCNNIEELACDPGFCPGVVGGSADAWSEDECAVVPQPCECVEAPPLEPGTIGRHSSLAIHDGIAHVSAYEDEFGDLVVGTADEVALSTTFSWAPVDGVPDGVPTAAPSGWRGGVSDRGDDVGYYTSIQVGSDGQVRVAYFDQTNKQLKFALGQFGQKAGFTTHVVDAEEDRWVGQYAAMTLLSDDRPMIAYMAHRIRRDSTIHSELRIATSSRSTPGSSDWDIDVLDETVMPCAGLCGFDEVCLADSWRCATEISGCVVVCATGEACVDIGDGPSCEPTLSANSVDELPWGVGLWSAFAASGSERALAWQLRLPETSALRAATYDGSFSEPFVLDNVVEFGRAHDLGQHVSLTYDSSGRLHAAHLDATSGELVYIQWQGGVVGREIVDDGFREAGDSRLVGADSAIAIGADGLVRVLYQDQTFSDLMVAKRKVIGTWEPQVLDVELPGAGFYINVVADDAGNLVATTFAYDPSAEPRGGLKILPVP